MSAGLREGDAEKAAARLGNFTMSVLTVAEGGQGGNIKLVLVLEPTTETVARAGLRLVLTAPPNAVPAVTVLMANAANQKGGNSSSSSQPADQGAPKTPTNRREPGKLPPGEENLKPGTSPLGEGDVDVYGSGSGRKGSRVGDQLEMHEPWQSSDLVDKMVPTRAAREPRARTRPSRWERSCTTRSPLDSERWGCSTRPRLHR